MTDSVISFRVTENKSNKGRSLVNTKRNRKVVLYYGFSSNKERFREIVLVDKEQLGVKELFTLNNSFIRQM